MKRFIKNIEDFSCEFCGKKVCGNGYTNHCPYCLWSKHVDVNPGDRLSKCGGMMRPAHVERTGGGKEFVIMHICDQCGHTKNNRIVAYTDVDSRKGQVADDFNKLIEIQGQSIQGH